MMLVGDDVEADVVAKPVFVENLVVELRRDLRIAVFVRQAGAHRFGLVEHLRRDEG